jgi:GntR family transcriptional regulator/MocR family aminotransferase
VPDEARGARDLLLELDLRRGRMRRSLQESLRRAIQEGRLPAGTPLPSSRRLSADLGVSRGVVADTYDQLASEGYRDVKRDRRRWSGPWLRARRRSLTR